MKQIWKTRRNFISNSFDQIYMEIRSKFGQNFHVYLVEGTRIQIFIHV